MLRLLRPHRGPVFISIGEGGSVAFITTTPGTGFYFFISLVNSFSITRDNKKDAYKGLGIRLERVLLGRGVFH